jgi:hypothetical protein
MKIVWIVLICGFSFGSAGGLILGWILSAGREPGDGD